MFVCCSECYWFVYIVNIVTASDSLASFRSWLTTHLFYQTALNAAARLIFNLRRSGHITDALVSLHWLRVSERIDYKITVLTYRVLHGDAQRYLARSPLSLTFPVAELCGRLSPITCHLSDCQLSAAELFRLPPPGSGILYRSTSSRQQHSSPSRNT